MKFWYLVLGGVLILAVVYLLIPNSIFDAGQKGKLVREDNISLKEAGDKIIGDLIQPQQPATKIYKSAEEAFNAVKEAAKKYDIEVLERFSLLESCAWCEEFYEMVRKELVKENLSEEEKAYLCELLTSSGNPLDIDYLIELYESSTSDSDKEIFLRSLEMTVANDKVLDKLFEKYNEKKDNPALRDSIVAALTVQGSSKAIEYLYSIAEAQDNPLSDAEKALGLSEAIPSDEALGFLEDKLQKGDGKLDFVISAAILNNGLQGLKLFVDLLQSPVAQRLSNHFEKLVDHVPYDEEIKSYLNYVKEKGSDSQKVFANKVLSAFEIIQAELEKEEPADEEFPEEELDATQE